MPRVATQAKDSPVMRSKSTDPGELPMGHTIRKDAVPDGKTAAERVGVPGMVQVADRMPDKEHMEMLAFMAEPIEIQIGHTNDKNAVPFDIIVNGHIEVFHYGETKTVPRYIVDHMAHLKVTTYDTPEKVNSQGEKYTDRVPTTAMKYPFIVTHDPHPAGRDWLRATLAMPG